MGRNLPTVYHWFRAANTDDSRFLVALSNFSGQRPVAVGRSNAIGSYGPVDMAGNVREWCWNATGHQRYLLGGSWADPAYMLTRGQLAPPLDRQRIPLCEVFERSIVSFIDRSDHPASAARVSLRRARKRRRFRNLQKHVRKIAYMGHSLGAEIAPEVRNDLVREVLAWLDTYLGKT